MKNSTRYILLFLILAVVVVAILYIESYRPDISAIREEAQLEVGAETTDPAILEAKRDKYTEAKEIVRPAGYVNSEAVKISDYIGKKIILLDFMTYTCINCQRTWPYVTAWDAKYKDKGLQIIGIHTPEFEFEKDINNVREALSEAGIMFPVVLDNDYGTWTAYGNRYWPRKYLIDIDGFIVYDHIGEGGYDETETKIQELLKERNERLGIDETIAEDIVKPQNVETVEVGAVASPETYFGAFRNTNLGNGIAKKEGFQSFKAPDKPVANMLYFDGNWDIKTEFAENQDANAKIIFKFQSQKVFMVARADEPVTLEIYQDGELVKEVTVQEDKLYRLIENDETEEHLLEIVVKNPGLKAFTFTFG